MATATSAGRTTKPAGMTTFEELHERLGFVPLWRVRLDPPPGTATVADVERFADAGDQRLYELVDRTLIEKPMGTLEGFLSGFILRRIGAFADEHELGIVTPGDAGFQLAPDSVRFPDVSFIPFSRLPPNGFPPEAIWAVVPTLAVEVLSPSNTAAEIDRKLRDLFGTGCRLAWVIDPPTQTARVYSSASRYRTLPPTGVLEGGRVLPGFRLFLAELFAPPPRPRRRK